MDNNEKDNEHGDNSAGSAIVVILKVIGSIIGGAIALFVVFFMGCLIVVS